jgi:2-polyprenyl-6-methoxyphenol hydroxylase-like FAD-dependent oxidoreductase
LHPRAVASLARWGLLERVVATGCPPIHTYLFDFGPVALRGAPGTPDSPVGYCPRRILLDKILVDAAREAGAEVREGFTVTEIVQEDGTVVGIRGRGPDGQLVTEHAPVVIGADGRHSLVAEAVHAEQYETRPPLMSSYYTYFKNLPLHGVFENYARKQRGFAALDTNDGLTMVVAGWPYAEFEAQKRDLEANFMAVFELAPAFAERMQKAERVAKLAGAAVQNFFRKPYGPGWALVGDAGYTRDPITAQGMLDAFRDAERCALALDDALRGRASFDEALAAYHRERDADVRPMFELTCQIAAMAPPPPEFRALLGAASGNQRAMDRFAQMNAATISPAEFMSPASIGEIMAAAAARGTADARGQS